MHNFVCKMGGKVFSSLEGKQFGKGSDVKRPVMGESMDVQTWRVG